jgi:methyl-accepting chemotaxis protein
VAAREIRSLIGVSVDKAELGTLNVRQARDTMSAIDDAVARVVQVIGDISTGTREQSASMASINTALSRLDQMTQQNAAVVEESAAAAQSLQAQAGDLRDMAGQFRLPALALAFR